MRDVSRSTSVLLALARTDDATKSTSDSDFTCETLRSRIRDSEPREENDIRIRRIAPGSLLSLVHKGRALRLENLLLAECVTSMRTNAWWTEASARLALAHMREESYSMKNYQRRQLIG